jgi:hypothetical protein
VPGCPADEFALDGRAMQSMTALAMGNYASQAIAAGLPDLGWLAVERIYRARYERDGCPWDAPLQWSGDGNFEPQWGRWYMSHPASWYVLWALGGVRLDRLRNSLMVQPSWPAAWGDELRALPVFFPGLQGEIGSRRSAQGLEVTFTVKRAISPLVIKTAGIRLPPDFRDVQIRGSVVTDAGATATVRDGDVIFDRPLTFAQPGDGFTLAASRP